MRLTPRGLAVASRNAIISRNFQVVDMQQWKGEGRRVECLDREVEHDAGVLADRIKSMTGFSNSATTSRMISMDSASRRRKCRGSVRACGLVNVCELSWSVR
jgi:hypothetical protein